MRRLAWASATLGFLLGAAPGVHADPPGAAERRQAEQQLQRRIERLVTASAPPASAPSAAPLALPPTASAAPAHADLAAELARKWAAVAETRLARREQHRALLLREVGTRLQDPQVKAELALHAKRVAELGRLEFLTKNARSGEARSKLLGRIARLLARETERHQRRLAKLAGPSVAASSSAPAHSAAEDGRHPGAR